MGWTGRLAWSMDCQSVLMAVLLSQAAGGAALPSGALLYLQPHLMPPPAALLSSALPPRDSRDPLSAYSLFFPAARQVGRLQGAATRPGVRLLRRRQLPNGERSAVGRVLKRPPVLPASTCRYLPGQATSSHDHLHCAALYLLSPSHASLLLPQANCMLFVEEGGVEAVIAAVVPQRLPPSEVRVCLCAR